MPDLYIIFLLLALGAFVGVAAGLLGIGGGGIMVPAFTALFIAQDVPDAQLVHFALGTSMASIILTSLASLRAHHTRKGVSWSIVRTMVPGVLLGTFLAALMTKYINTVVLAAFFSLFMLYVAVQMFRSVNVTPTKSLPGAFTQAIAGAGIGAVSALVSIGGGSLSVPYLLRHGLEIKNAIGTSAAMGLPIAIAGTIGYVISGWANTSMVGLNLGFVYLPAVVCVSIMSFLTAPIGVNLAYKLPVSQLKKIFGVLVFSISVKMFLSVL